MYQAGEPTRNTLVTYFSLIKLSKGDCVGVIGVSYPIYEYENRVDNKFYAPVIEADSVEKIDCLELLEPAKPTSLNCNDV